MEELFNQLENDLQNKVIEVIEILKEKSNTSEQIFMFTEVDNEKAVDLVEEYTKSNVIETAKPMLTNVFAIAKYISLFEEQEKNIKDLDKYLTSRLDSSKVSWNILRNFESNVVFFKTNENGEINNLVAKYTYSNDFESFYFYICSNNCSWKVTTNELKNLLEGNDSTSSPININRDVLLNLKYNGMEILVLKDEV